jgi:hypothetical protein
MLTLAFLMDFSQSALFFSDLKCVKVKLLLEQATKAQRGSRGIALPFL